MLPPHSLLSHFSTESRRTLSDGEAFQTDIHAVHIWWAGARLTHAHLRAFGPACRRLAVAMRAAATGARREGWPHFLLLCLCLASSLAHRLHQLAVGRGGWVVC